MYQLLCAGWTAVVLIWKPHTTPNRNSGPTGIEPRLGDIDVSTDRRDGGKRFVAQYLGYEVETVSLVVSRDTNTLPAEAMCERPAIHAAGIGRCDVEFERQP